MQKVVLIISIIVNIILAFILISNKPVRVVSNGYINKIDSLETILTKEKGKRDSISKEIDTIFINIKENNNKYEEKVSTIISNNVTDDYIFFTEYLQRYDSLYHSKTAKIN